MKKRVYGVIIAIVLTALAAITLAGCTSNQYDELGELYGIESSSSDSQDEVKEEENVENGNVSNCTQVNCNCECNQEAFAKQVSELVEQKLTEILGDYEALKKENEELKAQITPAVEVIDDVVYCDIEYFLERATITFDDGTSALIAVKEGEAVVLDDIHAVDARANYRDKVIELPMKDGKVAITFNTHDVLKSVFGSKALMYSSKIETGYELVEVSKEEWDEELQLVAVCVPNEDSEFGYDFFVVAKEQVKNTSTPVATEKPAAPQKPSVPQLPSEPTEPSEPDKPSEPDMPSEPVKPDQPAHNQRPDDDYGEDGDSTQRPESDGTEVETPAHNDRPGQENDGDSTQKPESDGTEVETPAHNPRPRSSSAGDDGSTQSGETNGTVVEEPSHSERP